MDEWVKKIVEEEKQKRKLPLEAKQLGNNRYYLYHSTTRWDKEEKKQKKVSKYIGRITCKGVLEKGERSKPSVYDYGACRILHDLVMQHLHKPLMKHFPDDANAIEAIAIMKVLRDLPIKQMKTFWEKQYLSLEQSPPALSPNTITGMYKRIGQNLHDQHHFFSHFIKKDHYYAFDLSSIFSESGKATLSENGYNHNGIKSRQINLVLLHSITENLPAMLKPIHGSVREIKTLKKQLEFIDLSKIKIIIDRGHASYKLAETLENEGLFFAMPLRRNFDIINYDSEFENVFTYHGRGIRWNREETKYGTLFLFEDVKLKADEETNFIAAIENGKKEVKDLQEAKKKFGKIAILTNYYNNGDEEENGKLLYLDYKSRECVETAFDSLMNQLEIDKTYLQSDDAIRGYLFVVFNALFLYYKVLGMLKNANMNSKVSVSDLLLMMSKVYMVDYHDRWILSEIPKKVEDCVEKLGIGYENIFPINLRS